MKMVGLIAIFSLMLPVVSSAQNGTELLGLLKAGDFKNLESFTKKIQTKFEDGALSEIELRNTYRPFYNLDQENLDKVEEWERKIPVSYAAHLIRGTYFKRRGGDARGDKYISETPPENIKKMEQYFEIAKSELNASLKLTPKPFLSVFQLLQISAMTGDEETSSTLLASANKMLPSNTLVRNRFMVFLKPRWCGSYAQMKEFIAKSKEEGASAAGIMQLEAIMYDDMGDTAMDRGDKRLAVENLLKALEIGQRVGGEFRKDFLESSNYYSCREPDLKKYCDQAIADYTKTIEIDPKYAYYYRGNAYRDKGQYDQAIADYTKTIEIDPKYAYAYVDRGRAYREKGQYDLAIADYTRAIEIDPKYALAYHNRGWTYANRRQYDLAIADYTKTIEIDPKQASAYNNRGIAYGQKRQYDLAIADYTRAIEIDPKLAFPYYARGVSYYFKKEYDKSWEDVKKAQNLGYQIYPKFLEDLRNASGRQN